MITSSRQIRAARTLLGWSQKQLAAKAGVARSTLAKLEAGQDDLHLGSLKKVETVLEAQGIEFLYGDGEGVRLRSPGKGRGTG